MMKKRMRDYRLPVGYDMWDTLHCTANCKTPCGRNVKPKPLETYADLSANCISYKPEKTKEI